MPTKKLKELSDQSLLQYYVQGNVAAFEVLYRRHAQLLHNFLVRQVHDSRISEELAQEAWCAVINQASRFEKRFSHGFKAWLFRIAHNKLVDHWRRNSVQTLPLSPTLIRQISSRKDPVTGAMATTELIEGLAQLSPPQLETILLKIEGFTYAEIGQITDSRKEAVKSRLRYARAAMATPA